MARRYWRSAEIEVLFRYPEEGTGLAVVLNRSEDSVTSMAWKLGLRAKNRVRRLVMARSRKAGVQYGPEEGPREGVSEQPPGPIT